MSDSQQDLRKQYSRRVETTLSILAPRIEHHLRELVGNAPRVDAIRVRSKSVERFLQKAAKEEDGRRKYSDPLNQIQDQIGARVIVFYPADVERIAASVVRAYFTGIEERALVPESPNEFGYEGRHFVLFIPSELIDSGWSRTDYPTFFELQVKTLFQHAWAEANHDLGYKAPKELVLEQRRKMAFTAAQAWGADQIFQELAEELQVFEPSSPRRPRLAN